MWKFMFSIQRIPRLNGFMSVLSLKDTSYVADEGLGVPVCSGEGS